MKWNLAAAEWSAVVLSLQVALTATTLSLPPGVLLGYVLARWRFPGKFLCEALVQLPLVLPPVVTGYLLLLLFGRQGWFGPWCEAIGVVFIFDWKGAALAAAVVSFPLLVRAVRLAFASVDPRLEGMSRTLGAGPLETWWRISLPLAWPGVLAGGLLAFARALGEFGATIMLAGNIPGQTRTLPLAIYTEMHEPGGISRSWPLVAAAVLISVAATMLAELLERRATAHSGSGHA